MMQFKSRRTTITWGLKKVTNRVEDVLRVFALAAYRQVERLESQLQHN